MYKTKNYIKKIDLHELLKKYFNQEKFIKYCQACKNYRKLWSCPPYNFNVLEFLYKYNTAYLIGTKIIFDEETIKKVNKPNKIEKFTYKVQKEVREQLRNILLNIEDNILDCVSLYAGSCLICKKCTRPQRKSCKNIKIMRYSLESLGFDVASISKELFGIELKWAKESLPEYLTLVSGVLSRNDINNFDDYFSAL